MSCSVYSFSDLPVNRFVYMAAKHIIYTGLCIDSKFSGSGGTVTTARIMNTGICGAPKVYKSPKVAQILWPLRNFLPHSSSSLLEKEF